MARSCFFKAQEVKRWYTNPGVSSLIPTPVCMSKCLWVTHCILINLALCMPAAVISVSDWGNIDHFNSRCRRKALKEQTLYSQTEKLYFNRVYEWQQVLGDLSCSSLRSTPPITYSEVDKRLNGIGVCVCVCLKRCEQSSD